jgi:hypothetical protein
MMKTPVSTENKKVQLMITISGKKVENLNTSANNESKVNTVESGVDRASHAHRTDIILPSTSTTVRVSSMREDFSNVIVPRKNSNTSEKNVVFADDQTKSISSNTFSPLVPLSTSKEKDQSPASDENILTKENNTEIEKYLILTSNLNSIISAAKDLEAVEQVFPKNLPELKIYEDVKPKVESKIVAMENKAEMKKSKIPINKRRSVPDIEKSLPMHEKLSPQTVHTQEARQPYHLSLSSSSLSSADETKPISTELNTGTIKFEVGTPVRPLRIISSNASSNIISPIIVTENDLSNDVPKQTESVEDVFHSPKSEASIQNDRRESSSTRRKIAYIPQLTIYTPEEQELLKSNILANSDSLEVSSIPPDSSIFPTFDDSLVRDNLTQTDNFIFPSSSIDFFYK